MQITPRDIIFSTSRLNQRVRHLKIKVRTYFIYYGIVQISILFACKVKSINFLKNIACLRTLQFGQHNGQTTCPQPSSSGSNWPQ